MAYQVTYSTLPVAVPTTTQYDYSSYNQQGKYSYSVSPPDAPESTISAPSGYSATTASSYAGSAAGDYESGSSTSSGSANGVDMQEYMQTRFENAFDPLPLDRTLAKQAQTSGLLNAKHREIMDLQALAQQRLAKSRARLAEGYQDAKEVKRDLEWTQKRVSAMKTKASRKHPKEYKQARQRYPSPEY